MRYGLLLVGICGASASTVAAAILSNALMEQFASYGTYWRKIRGELPSEIAELSIGGWDISTDTFAATINNHAIFPTQRTLISNPTVFKAIIGSNDYACRVNQFNPTHNNLSSAIDTVRHDIRSFRRMASVDKIIVINMSSPMVSSKVSEEGWDSAQAYSFGTVLEGADWVEFTPSPSITNDLITIAKQQKTRIAGRDGSTGQTIMKFMLRDFLEMRGFNIDGWYSTNLIGNHDGLVLSHPDYAETKIHDKMQILSHSVSSKDHIVDIKYFRPAGDNKESWDCISFSGFLGAKMSLRVNWHGRDSMLAAALCLDIVSCLMHADKIAYPYGIVSPLGIFFKNPVHAIDEQITFAISYQSLVDFLTTN